MKLILTLFLSLLQVFSFAQSLISGKIIDDKMKSFQFNDSNITLSEIETVKKVLFKKLINVYQLRIEYPK